MNEMGKRVKRSQPGLVAPVTETDTLMLPVKNIGRKSGVSIVDLRFLRDWLGVGSGRFLEAIRRNARRHVSAQTTYSSRRVLQKWAELSALQGWSTPSFEMAQEELCLQLSRLREMFFKSEVQAGNALSTAGNHWGVFTRLLDELKATKALPSIARSDSRFASPGPKLLLEDRATAACSPHPASTAPRNLNVAADSFNDDLFEPISISASDIDYIDEYEKRLAHSVDVIRTCALRDFEELERKRQEGKELISRFDPILLDTFKEISRHRFKDQTNGKSLIKVEEGHPDLLMTILGKL